MRGAECFVAKERTWPQSLSWGCINSMDSGDARVVDGLSRTWLTPEKTASEPSRAG